MTPATKIIPYHERLKKALDGRTNKWLHDKTGISQSEISRIVSGKLIPSDNQMDKIKTAFSYDFTIK